MAFCSNCGNKLEDGVKFCPNCGKQVADKEEPKGFIDSVKQGWKESWEEDSKSQKHMKGEKNKKMGCWTYGFIALLFFGFIGFLQEKCEGEDLKTTDAPTQQTSKQEAKEKVENAEPKKQESIHHDFFEKGYEYSASYRISRKQGYGLSANYKYKIKIYNDGTTEIVEEIIGDEFPGHPSELYKCKIDKKSESFRDVAATWYEVKFNGSNKLYVDNDGNIISLYENGNNKTIQEAISSGDCKFGKFSKAQLNNSKVYRCRTCGEEYNPDKEAIVSEEYCYLDYPQECKSCGKTYTVRQEGNDACKGTCASCYRKHRAVKIYEEATGRKVY